MFNLEVIFTGLVFFAQPPTDAKFTNAVLVTSNVQAEKHHAEFKITRGEVTVTKDGNPIEKDSWLLGPDAMVIIESSSSGPPERLANFISHVPSVSRALAKTPLSGKTAAPCTYAADLPGPCEYQNGRIRMSGGTLDASVPVTDHEYPFLTKQLGGDYWSRLAPTTMWQGSVEKIIIKEGGTTYELTPTTDVVIHAGSHPKKEDAHFDVLRHIYGASGADFPAPLDIYAFFRRMGKAFPKGLGPKVLATILTESRPVLCPPAAQ